MAEGQKSRRAEGQGARKEERGKRKERSEVRGRRSANAKGYAYTIDREELQN